MDAKDAGSQNAAGSAGDDGGASLGLTRTKAENLCNTWNAKLQDMYDAAKTDYDAVVVRLTALSQGDLSGGYLEKKQDLEKLLGPCQDFLKTGLQEEIPCALTNTRKADTVLRLQTIMSLLAEYGKGVRQSAPVKNFHRIDEQDEARP